ncbi:hypothetical protein J2X19_000527 [Rhodoferax ferrireducens]|uniref:Uncharacterized protein n=1 Tax=Rhodoferax ferrireducens TaxID=192843 RepID=A0ABU2C3H2_9BURK|nr:hypothetical protein [Rhodoferax ferrireducens]MDR7375869.1 hypothetical protein [Rhodoferax ferrireducens]
MSYHLTILRTANGKLHSITLDEARAAASQRGGWIFNGAQNSFELTNSEGSVTLWFQDGQLWTNSAEAWLFAPLLALAELLGGRVRGDEFETYQSAEVTFFHPDDVPLRREAEAASKLLVEKNIRQEKRIRNGIVGFFVILGFLGFAIGKWFEGR